MSTSELATPREANSSARHCPKEQGSELEITSWGVPHTVLGQVVPVVEPIGGGIAESVELVGVGRQADPSALGVPPERARNPRRFGFCALQMVCRLAYRTASFFRSSSVRGLTWPRPNTTDCVALSSFRARPRSACISTCSRAWICTNSVAADSGVVVSECRSHQEADRMLECTWLSGGCRPPGAANSDRGSCPKGSEEEEEEEEEKSLRLLS